MKSGSFHLILIFLFVNMAWGKPLVSKYGLNDVSILSPIPASQKELRESIPLNLKVTDGVLFPFPLMSQVELPPGPFIHEDMRTLDNYQDFHNLRPNLQLQNHM